MIDAVISPLLANCYLHAFDKMFQLSGIAGTLVRYADDFVILLRGKGKAVLDWVRRKLKRRRGASTATVADKPTGKVVKEPYRGKPDIRFDEGAEGRYGSRTEARRENCGQATEP